MRVVLKLSSIKYLLLPLPLAIVLFIIFHETAGDAHKKYFQSLKPPLGIETYVLFYPGTIPNCLDACDSAKLSIKSTRPMTITEFYNLVDQMFAPRYINYYKSSSDFLSTELVHGNKLENSECTEGVDTGHHIDGVILPSCDQYLGDYWDTKAYWLYQPVGKPVKGCSTLGGTSDAVGSSTQTISTVDIQEASFECIATPNVEYLSTHGYGK